MPSLLPVVKLGLGTAPGSIETLAQTGRQRGLGILDQGADVGDELPRARWNREAECSERHRQLAGAGAHLVVGEVPE